MKFFVDFFPVLAFFIAYFMPQDRSQGIYWATAAAIVASVIQVSATRLIYKKVEKMHLFTMIIILVLGSATLLLQDKRFIMWKPTVVNWAFGVVFFASQFIGKKNIIRRMMEKNFSAKDSVWTALNLSWVCFFMLMGIINLVVAFNFSEETWVNFKMFGMLGLTIVFAIGQSLFLARHITIENPEAGSQESVEIQKSGVRNQESEG